jgi:isopentenyl diphosphate isomerase/L-lactate dehydrogenase-like FMN-dependent dehydrogenase
MTRSLESVAHARRLAKRHLPGSVYSFIEGGNEARITVRANVEAFEEIGFRPRVSSNHSMPDTRTTVLGSELSMPLITTPAGFIRIAHPGGELAVARAAARAGIATGVSILASTSIEEVTAVNPDTWFQLYMIGGREGTAVAIERARRAGVRVLIVTVDLAAGTGGSDTRKAAMPPGRIDLTSAVRHAPEMLTHPRWAVSFLRGGLDLTAPNVPGVDGRTMTIAEGSAALREHPPTWDDIRFIREHWKGPLVVKGIITAEDARIAADLGADAVSVSNHGGNGLDGAPATIRALPEVVAAVGDRIEVLMDGGVRRGGDVVKAVSLGARAVLIGRPYIWALAAGGEEGVDQVLALFRKGISGTMALLDRRTISDLDETALILPG